MSVNQDLVRSQSPADTVAIDDEDASFCIWDCSRHEEWCSRHINRWIIRALKLLSQIEKKEVETKLDIINPENNTRPFGILSTHTKGSKPNGSVSKVQVGLIVCVDRNVIRKKLGTNSGIFEIKALNEQCVPVSRISVLESGNYKCESFVNGIKDVICPLDEMAKIIIYTTQQYHGIVMFDFTFSISSEATSEIREKVDKFMESELSNRPKWKKQLTKQKEERNSESEDEMEDDEEEIMEMDLPIARPRVALTKRIGNQVTSIFPMNLSKFLSDMDEIFRAPILNGSNLMFPMWGKNAMSRMDVHVTAAGQQWHTTESFKFNFQTEMENGKETNKIFLYTRVNSGNTPRFL